MTPTPAPTPALTPASAQERLVSGALAIIAPVALALAAAVAYLLTPDNHGVAPIHVVSILAAVALAAAAAYLLMRRRKKQQDDAASRGNTRKK